MAPKSEKNMDFCYFHHFLQQRHKNGTKPSKPIDLYAHFTSDKVTLSSFCGVALLICYGGGNC
jgi:hypothetical protein